MGRFCKGRAGRNTYFPGRTEIYRQWQEETQVRDPVRFFHAAKGFLRDIEDIRDGGSSYEPVHIMIFTSQSFRTALNNTANYTFIQKRKSRLKIS